jgi:hypothetical protein
MVRKTATIRLQCKEHNAGDLFSQVNKRIKKHAKRNVKSQTAELPDLKPVAKNSEDLAKLKGKIIRKLEINLRK